MKSIGLTELEPSETILIEGGFILAAIAAAIAIASAAIYVYNNAPDFAEGFKEGYQSTQNK